MKNTIKLVLHKLFGFENYLFIFSLYKIKTLKSDKNEKDFFHFLKLIPQNSIVLDIGANIGIMTVHLAGSIKDVTVFSFEPMPYNITALKRIINYFNLKNVEVFDTALGNTNGEIEMVMPVISNVKMQGLSHVVHDSISENNEGEKCSVAVKKLDSIIESLQIKKQISAIKIDVENFEFFVLDGGKNLLHNHKPIIYAELWDNKNRELCFELLTGIGYKTFVVIENKIVEYNNEYKNKQNFIFLPKENKN